MESLLNSLSACVYVWGYLQRVLIYLICLDEVYSWGYGKNYQLGQQDDRNQAVPKRIQLFNKQQIIMVSSGKEFTVALSKKGEVISNYHY